MPARFELPLPAEQAQRARETAHAMLEYRGFQKSEIARVLASQSDFNKAVLRFYMELQDFSNMDIVSALRSLLNRFSLVGEAHEIDRILQAFAERYVDQNRDDCSADAVCILASAILLLNTDLHALHNDRPMTLKQFVDNLMGMNDGDDFRTELLKNIYLDIRNREIALALDDLPGAAASGEDDQTHVINPAPGRPEHCVRVFFLGEPVGEKTMEGTVQCKETMMEGGKPTPKGKRKWKPLHATLCQHILILHQNKYQPYTARDLTQNVYDALTMRHALARLALDYGKRDNVFELRLASGRTLLMQAESERDLLEWIGAINRVAALTSAPPLPAPVTSAHMGFRRPVLPESRTRETTDEIFARYKIFKERIERDLTEHESQRESMLGEKDKRVAEFWNDKYEYLLFERERVKTYLAILRDALGATLAGLTNEETDAARPATGIFRFSKDGSAQASMKPRTLSLSNSDRVSWV